MVSLDKAIIATYEKEGEKFEVFLDPDKTYEYLDGRKTDLSGLLVVD
ncbi:MAG: ribosome assembly factor SBDS, partial [Candidatus Micrarchaeia archaeon]